MKTTAMVRFALMIQIPMFLRGQNLIVGYSNPNQVLTLRNVTASYDSVIVMSHGTLKITASNVTVNGGLGVIGNGSLLVGKSGFASTA